MSALNRTPLAAINFDDDTDDEAEGDNDAAASGAFGDNAEGGAAVPSAWGAGPEGGDAGFAPDAGFTAEQIDTLVAQGDVGTTWAREYLPG